MRSSGTQVWSESDRGVGKVNQIVYEFEQKSKFQKLPPCLECCQIQCLKPLTVVGLLQSFGDFCPSVRPSVCPSVRPYGKGRLRESTHLRITRHLVTLSPAQWYNSVQLWLPF